MLDPYSLPPLDRTERHNAPFFAGGYLQLDFEELSLADGVANGRMTQAHPRDGAEATIHTRSVLQPI